MSHYNGQKEVMQMSSQELISLLTGPTIQVKALDPENEQISLVLHLDMIRCDVIVLAFCRRARAEHATSLESNNGNTLTLMQLMLPPSSDIVRTSALVVWSYRTASLVCPRSLCLTTWKLCLS